jgi:hypothetical protein
VAVQAGAAIVLFSVSILAVTGSCCFWVVSVLDTESFIVVNFVELRAGSAVVLVEVSPRQCEQGQVMKLNGRCPL